MEISAKADYAVRAVAELAAREGRSMTTAELADAQGIPVQFLQNILLQLRRRGILHSQRGAEGGYRLSRPASEITVADVLRAVEGPLAAIRGEPPEDQRYAGHAVALTDAWVALRVSLRGVLEEVTVRQLADGNLPAGVAATRDAPGARRSR
ncbi:MAG: RrF2 family transcriptional regulator [Acidimicrobiales bacterium]